MHLTWISLRRNIMDNDVFWQRNENLLKPMKPISTAILIVEGDSAVLSDAVKQFLIMKQAIESTLQQSPLSTAEEAKVLTALGVRYKNMITSAHNAAYLLDPRYTGEGLSGDDFTDAVDLIIDLSGHEACDIVPEIANFREHTGRFASKHIWNL